jgi:hypothetical protein
MQPGRTFYRIPTDPGRKPVIPVWLTLYASQRV